MGEEHEPWHRGVRGGRPAAALLPAAPGSSKGRGDGGTPLPPTFSLYALLIEGEFSVVPQLLNVLASLGRAIVKTVVGDNLSLIMLHISTMWKCLTLVPKCF